jgi:hypothetical protein
MHGVFPVNTVSGIPLFHPEKGGCLHGFAVHSNSPPVVHIIVCHSARYFIFEGNVIVLPATMNAPLPR